MNKDYLVTKAGTIEKMKEKNCKYSDHEEKIEFENSIEIMSKLFEGLDFYERSELILASIGIDIKLLEPPQIICYLLRLLPLIGDLIHTIELGAPATGKSSLYQILSNDYHCISGSFTEPTLFGSEKSKSEGILSSYSAVAIDEAPDIGSVPQNVLTKLKDYTASGNIGRNGEEKKCNTSIAFLGNTRFKEEEVNDLYLSEKIDIYSDLPDFFNDDAIRSRISYVIPGWVLPKRFPTITDENIKGFNIHLFIDYLKKSKEKSYPFKLNDYPELDSMTDHLDSRIINNLEKSIKAFLKLIFPKKDYTYDDVIAIGSILYSCNRILHNEPTGKKKNKFVQKLYLKLLKERLPHDTSNILSAYIYDNRFIIHFEDDKEHLYKIAMNNKGRIDNEKEKNLYDTSTYEIKERLLPFVSLNDDKSVAKFKFHEIYGGFQKMKLANQEKETNDPIEKLNMEVSKLNEEIGDLKKIIFSMAEQLNKLRKDNDSIRAYIKRNDGYNNNRGIFYENYDFFKMPNEHLKDLFEIQIEEISNTLGIPSTIKECEVCLNQTNEKFMLLNYSEVKVKVVDPLEQFN